tara:strand:+ start:72 stop:686 length:615 start_codon:yes stop_codon:yes gene_type:complete
MDNNYLLYTLPLIAALIGWVTNYLAVKMLFHPRLPINLGLFTLQGVFPKRQKDLAVKLGDIVARDLFSMEDVIAKINAKASNPEILKSIEDGIVKVIKEKLPIKFPMLAMFLNDEMVDSLKGVFMEDFQGTITGLIEKLGSSLEDEIDVKAIVEEKVINFSSDKLEEVLFEIMRKEFRFIEFIGAVLGFFIGVVQVFIVRGNLG